VGFAGGPKSPEKLAKEAKEKQSKREQKKREEEFKGEREFADRYATAKDRIDQLEKNHQELKGKVDSYAPGNTPDPAIAKRLEELEKAAATPKKNLENLQSDLKSASGKVENRLQDRLGKTEEERKKLISSIVDTIAIPKDPKNPTDQESAYKKNVQSIVEGTFNTFDDIDLLRRYDQLGLKTDLQETRVKALDTAIDQTLLGHYVASRQKIAYGTQEFCEAVKIATASGSNCKDPKAWPQAAVAADTLLKENPPAPPPHTPTTPATPATPATK
jgi:hypothetical protein